MERVILASRNKGKLREICAILEKFGMETVSRDDAGLPTFEVEETGETFEENSFIKAKAISDITHAITIADDSGLEVDALNGAPGVYSARYAGEGCTPADNNEKLLRELQDVPEGKRGAAFVSVITMLFPNGDKLVARGECRGRIALELRGDGGFGYDPLFIPDGESRSFGEMSADEKNRISHRARSLQILEKMIQERKYA